MRFIKDDVARFSQYFSRDARDGIFSIDELVKMCAKVFRSLPNFNPGPQIPSFSLGPDRPLIVDCPAKLTRLVFFDPNGTLERANFKMES